MLPARAPIALALLALSLPACKASGGSNSPGLIEQVAGDVEHEINNVGSTAHGAADDVDETAKGVTGPSSPPPRADDAETSDDPNAAPPRSEADAPAGTATEREGNTGGGSGTLSSSDPPDRSTP